MANKKLRILIADRSASDLPVVERMLNRLGYYRIATTASISEAYLLSQCTDHRFDVLIVSARLFNCEMLSCVSISHICHSALIYQGGIFQCITQIQTFGVTKLLPGRLCAESLKVFMKEIDPSLLSD